MNGYLSKPIRPQELDGVLEPYILEKYSKDTPSEKATPQAHEAIDVRELLDRIGNDHEFLEELVEIFRQDYPKQVQTLHQVIDLQDADGLKRAAHSLKGALANLSAGKASALAADLEEMGKSKDFASTSASMEALEEELRRVMDELENLSKEAPR